MASVRAAGARGGVSEVSSPAALEVGSSLNLATPLQSPPQLMETLFRGFPRRLQVSSVLNKKRIQFQVLCFKKIHVRLIQSVGPRPLDRVISMII